MQSLYLSIRQILIMLVKLQVRIKKSAEGIKAYLLILWFVKIVCCSSGMKLVEGLKGFLAPLTCSVRTLWYISVQIMKLTSIAAEIWTLVVVVCVLVLFGWTNTLPPRLCFFQSTVFSAAFVCRSCHKYCIASKSSWRTSPSTAKLRQVVLLMVVALKLPSNLWLGQG